MRRFNLILNYERSEICIFPNASFHQPFDYSYSGIMIARIGEQIQVVDVMEDSPAEKAETVDLTLPAKPALELEPSQIQGSHVNGVGF